MTPDAYRELVHGALADARHAGADSWLPAEALAACARVELDTPASIFTDPQRPLVVAFFGGTGVGKSSLLNRLAGAALARVGVTRPTSHEVTLYLHADATLAALPPEIPAERTHVHRHNLPERRDVAWVDMPDIDSTDESNARLALRWLAHVDVLVYVVSPERYRDDRGWRVLLDRRGRHGWLFVFNHWDAGAGEQRRDWRTLLQGAGFRDPLLFCTSCADAGGADQFHELIAEIERLRAAHATRELERLGFRARLVELARTLRAAAVHLGEAPAWQAFAAESRMQWRGCAETLLVGMRWPAAALARGLAANPAEDAAPASRLASLLPLLADRFAKPVDAGAPAAPSAESSTPARIDDLWSAAGCPTVMDSFVTAIENAARRSGLPAAAVQARVREGLATLPQWCRGEWQRRVPAALAVPGTPAQRTARQVTGFLMTFLPLISLGWVGWQVIAGFYRASTGAAEYLGGNFAIHGALLVVTTWAIPFALDRVLKPSRRRAVEGALHAGARAALATAQIALNEALAAVEQEGARRRAMLIAAAERLERAPSAAVGASGPVLRLLAEATP